MRSILGVPVLSVSALKHYSTKKTIESVTFFGIEKLVNFVLDRVNINEDDREEIMMLLKNLEQLIENDNENSETEKAVVG